MMEAWFSASEMMASSGPKQRLEDAAVGVEAGLENRMVSSVPRNCETRCFQLQVQVLGAADEAHAGHAEAALVHGVLGGGDDVRVVGQAQVVVGAEVQDLAAGPPVRPAVMWLDCGESMRALGLEQAGRRGSRPVRLQLVLDGVRVHALLP